MAVEHFEQTSRVGQGPRPHRGPQGSAGWLLDAQRWTRWILEMYLNAQPHPEVEENKEAKR